jgi:hypothetical protein
MGGRFVDFLLLRFGLARAPPFCGALAGYQRPCADFHDDGAEAKRAQLVKEGRADVVTLAKAADAIRIDVAITALILGRPAGAMRTLALLGGSVDCATAGILAAAARCNEGIGRFGHGSFPRSLSRSGEPTGTHLTVFWGAILREG